MLPGAKSGTSIPVLPFWEFGMDMVSVRAMTPRPKNFAIVEAGILKLSAAPGVYTVPWTTRIEPLPESTETTGQPATATTQPDCSWNGLAGSGETLGRTP